jgi:small GTP-binding protein
MGAAAVGKSALTQQFTQHIFNKAYDPTIETQTRKLVDIDGVNSALEIIDTGGQLEYLCLRDQYIAGGEGFLLVYNIRRKQSFTMLALMRKKILEIKGVDEFPMVVVGAQSDSPANRRQVTKEELEALGKQWRVPVFETSAKDRVNVEEPYKALIRMIRAEDEIKNAGKARLKDFLNPHEWWLDQTKRHEITILVFYRGLWCPFCKNYMKGWNKLVREIWDKGGVIYGVTAQSQAMADKAEKKWRLNYDVISDQENTLAKTHGIHITNTVIMDYPKGMVQPGVFIITNKQQILYKWAVSPNITNLEGAIDRPDPKDVWQNIKNLQEGNLNRVKIHHSTRRWMFNN